MPYSSIPGGRRAAATPWAPAISARDASSAQKRPPAGAPAGPPVATGVATGGDVQPLPQHPDDDRLTPVSMAALAVVVPPSRPSTSGSEEAVFTLSIGSTTAPYERLATASGAGWQPPQSASGAGHRRVGGTTAPYERLVTASDDGSQPPQSASGAGHRHLGGTTSSDEGTVATSASSSRPPEGASGAGHRHLGGTTSSDEGTVATSASSSRPPEGASGVGHRRVGASFFASPPAAPAAPRSAGHRPDSAAPATAPGRRIAYKSKTLGRQARTAYGLAVDQAGLGALTMRASALVMAPAAPGGGSGEVVIIGSHFAKGGFGKVHPALMPDGRPVAAKQLRGVELQLRDHFRQQARDKGPPTRYSTEADVEREVALLRLGISQMRLYGVVETVDRRTYLMTSLMAGSVTELNTWLWSGQPSALAALGLAITQLGQVAGQLRRMRDDHRLVHRDIKPDNLLVAAAAPHDFVIGDLGLAAKVAAGGTRLSTGDGGTWEYMAPERWRAGRPYDFASDVFSLGAAVLETAVGRRLYDARVAPRGEDPRGRRHAGVALLQDAWGAWQPGTFAGQPALLAQVPAAAGEHFADLRRRLDALDPDLANFLWRRLLDPDAAGRAGAAEAEAWAEQRLRADPALADAAASARAAFAAADPQRSQQFDKLRLFRDAKLPSLAS